MAITTLTICDICGNDCKEAIEVSLGGHPNFLVRIDGKAIGGRIHVCSTNCLINMPTALLTEAINKYNIR